MLVFVLGILKREHLLVELSRGTVGVPVWADCCPDPEAAEEDRERAFPGVAPGFGVEARLLDFGLPGVSLILGVFA